MAKSIPVVEIGFCGCTFNEIVKEYRRFYSKEKEETYGVVAIKIKL